MDDLETDFIVMSGKHHPHGSCGIEGGNGIAHDIAFYFTALCKVVTENFCRIGFVSGGTGGTHQTFQKIHTGFAEHDFFLLKNVLCIRYRQSGIFSSIKIAKRCPECYII